MWDLVPQQGIEPRPPALRVWSLSDWTTRVVSVLCFKLTSVENYVMPGPALVAL